MNNVVRIDPRGRAREEASGVHGRAMVERHRRELIAIYRNRQARIAASRFAWSVRLVVVGAVCLAAGHLTTLLYAEPYQALEKLVKQAFVSPLKVDHSGIAANTLIPQAAATSVPSVSASTAPVNSHTHSSPTIRANAVSPVIRSQAMPPGRPTAPKGAPTLATVVERRSPALLPGKQLGQSSSGQRGAGVYEAPVPRPEASQAIAFKVIEVPANDVALIQQGATIKPIKVGERLPDNTILKSAISGATGVETSHGRLTIDRKSAD